MMAAGRLPSQTSDFPAWYVEVVKQAGMAEHGLARGSQVIKPYGFAIWENIQRALDDRFKATGHENLMFPLLFPMKLLEKEAEHVEGFAPQVAVVTRGGGEELDEPLVIRPTSEALIWSYYANWIQSYRDLPLLYNQWCNVLRWEMRTRLFLRTSEFLWQEGHTAHTTKDEAIEEALRMLEVYREVAEDVLAVPVLPGRKSELERFPGAVDTYTLEAMMRDTKALQFCTSHFLGQNFAKAYEVTYLSQEGRLEHPWATSWGWSTRTIGGLVMAHGDDTGLRLPPAVAPVQVVVVPIYKSDDERASVIEVAEKVRDALVGNSVRVKIDDRDQHRPGYKFSEWEMKGVPVRVEIGPRDVADDHVVLALRTGSDKQSRTTAQAIVGMAATLDAVQKALYEDADSFRVSNTHDATTYDELRDGLVGEGGFWVAPWCGDRECEQQVTAETKGTIRVLPITREDPGGPCVVCGKAGLERATWARSY